MLQNGFKRFDQEKLPNNEYFYSSLKDEYMSSKQITTMPKNLESIKNIGDRHDLC